MVSIMSERVIYNNIAVFAYRTAKSRCCQNIRANRKGYVDYFKNLF